MTTTITSPSTPAGRIAAIYKKHDGRQEPIIKAIADLARTDDDVLNYLAGVGVRTVYAHLIGQDRRDVRGETSERQIGDGISAGLKRAAATAWLSYPLAGGVKLADATHKMVTEAVKIRLDQARSMNSMAQFLRRVAEKMSGDGRVRDFWTENKLAKIAAETGAKL
jgi:hypothetical protein